jgi:hypothetical protein
MLSLMIVCSRTGHLISTGIQTDTKTYDVLPDVESATYCPHCKRMHRWSKADVSSQFIMSEWRHVS